MVIAECDTETQLGYMTELGLYLDRRQTLLFCERFQKVGRHLTPALCYTLKEKAALNLGPRGAELVDRTIDNLAQGE